VIIPLIKKSGDTVVSRGSSIPQKTVVSNLEEAIVSN